jgi:hypothetical protein
MAGKPVELVSYSGGSERKSYINDPRNYWVFGLCPSSGILKNATFRKLDPFPSSGERVGTPALLSLSINGPVVPKPLNISVSLFR